MTPRTTLRAPFPWFGGKLLAAPMVWDAIGADVPNYIEPFAGSMAALLARPAGAIGTETVNDADGLLCNFWRALQADPEAVAQWADWPVSECDLSARHLWLVGQRAALTERLQVDPDHYDAKIAGWWVWGICAWIGSGWCSGDGPWTSDGERWIGNAGRGINRKLPHLGDAGQGINRQLPHLGNAGRGINRQLPHLGNAGRGINRQLPHLGDAGQGIAPRRQWIEGFAARLRGVRICCGDWRRAVTDSVTVKHGITGILLDPPYPAGFDDAYSAGDGGDIWHECAAWAVEAGADRRLRIVLCGYDGTWTAPDGWREVPWKAKGGYNSVGDGEKRSHRERLWLSPGCLDNSRQVRLFGAAK